MFDYFQIQLILKNNSVVKGIRVFSFQIVGEKDKKRTERWIS